MRAGVEGAGFTLRGLVLALDASTARGSVAVLRDGEVVARGGAEMRGATEERLMPAVAAALAAAGARPAALDRIVCGGGPGGFTGLRIAAGIAKGMALASGAPLHAVGSLALLVAGAAAALGVGRFVAVTDAMRHERFAQPCDVGSDGAVTPLGAPRLMTEPELARLAAAEGWVRVGPLEAGHATWPDAAGVA
ncbi:MAG TPA: tRNA (adenosine(37)-N6)-threonylcarbamoyltransferase complex dimerization subunit type 1 TsaB, partial [Gemmatimonadaceae bacterium]